MVTVTEEAQLPKEFISEAGKEAAALSRKLLLVIFARGGIYQLHPAMRRTRLKILPSRCVTTLGFTLLLLACPTIAEEIVRPARFSETEATGTHAHARVKNIPPEAFEMCKKGDNILGAVLRHRETNRTSSRSSDLKCQPNNKYGNLAGISRSNRIRVDVADNANTRVCDAGGRSSAVSSMGLRRRSTERSINALSRRSRAASEDVRRSRINRLLATSIGMREESRCHECDLRGRSRQLNRQQSNGMVARRIDAKSTTGEIKSQGRRYSEDHEASGGTRVLMVERNDRSTSHRDYSSENRMREARREIRTTETLMVKETPHEEVRSNVLKTICLSEREERDLRMSGERTSLERQKRSTTLLDRLVERRLPVQSREPLTAARSSRSTRSLLDVRSDIRDAYGQSLFQSVDSRRTNTRYVRGDLSLTRRDSIVSRVETFGSRVKDNTVTNTGALIVRSGNGRLSNRAISLSRQRRERNISQVSRRLSEGRGDRVMRAVLERYSDRRDTLRRLEPLESERRLRRNTRIDQLPDRRLPVLNRDSATSESSARRTSSVTSVRSDALESSLRRSDLVVAERKIRRASSADEIFKRRPPVTGQESTAERRTRSVPSASPDTRDTSRRDTFLHSEDSRMVHVRSIPGETYVTSIVRRDASVPRVEISRSQSDERTKIVPANKLSGNQRMNIRENALSLQRRGHDSVQASRRFVDDQRDRNERVVFERSSGRRNSLRRSESLPSERRIRSTSRIVFEQRIPVSFHEPSPVDRTISRSSSLSSFRSESRGASRRSQSYSAGFRRSHSGSMPEESSHALNTHTRIARVDISRSRGDEKIVLGRRSVIDISSSISPSLQRRERDSGQAFRRSTEGQRVRDVRAALESYADGRDPLRRSEYLGADRRTSSTLDFDRLSERRSPVLGRETISAERSVRRRWSIPSVRSDIREASQRSYSADLHRTSIGSMQEDTYHASKARRYTNVIKTDIIGSRRKRKMSLARDQATDISGNRGMDIRTNSLSLIQGEHSSAQSPVRIVEYQKARNARPVFEWNRGKRGTLRSSEIIGQDRRIRSTSRIDLSVEQQSPMQVREYTTIERSARRIQSISPVRAEIRDIFRRSHSSKIDSLRLNTRSISKETIQFSSARRDTIVSRVEIDVSRDQGRITSGFCDAKEHSGNERRSSRRVYLSGQRRERIALQAYKRFEEALEIRGVRAAFERYSERKAHLRHSESLETNRRVISIPQVNQISERRSPERDHELRKEPMITKISRSLSGVRSDSRDASRHSLYHSGATRRTQSTSVPVERHQSSSAGRDSRFSKVGISRSLDYERISLSRGPVIEASRSQRMEMRIKTLSLLRRERDSTQNLKRPTEGRWIRDIRDVFERNSDRRNALRRSESLGLDGRIGHFSRSVQISEHHLSVLSHDSTIAKGTTRKTKFISSVRSDILDVSRRSRSIDSRKINAISVRKDLYLGRSLGRDARVNRADISISQALARMPLARGPATEIARNRRVDIRPKPTSLHRRERDSAQASRRCAEDQMARDERATLERYTDRKDTLRRSESFRSEKSIRSTLRIDHSNERRLPALGRDSATTERAMRRTSSVPSVMSSVREYAHQSSLHSAKTRKTFSRFLADDLFQVPRETRVSRVEKYRSRGGDRASYDMIQALEISTNEEMRTRTTTTSLQRRERDRAVESEDDQMFRDVRSVFEMYSDRRDAFRRSESLGPERRILSTSRIARLAGRRSPVVDREYATAEKIAGRSRSVLSARTGIHEITRCAIRYSIGSRIKDSRSRILQSLPARVRENELGSGIFHSRSERRYLASRDRSEGKVRATLEKREISTVESNIRRANNNSRDKFYGRFAYRLSELKSRDSLRTYSPFERKEGSNDPSFRRNAQELRFTVTVPLTGEYENGKKLTGARRLSIRSQVAVIQQRERDASRESMLRRRESTLERVDHSRALSYRRDERETYVTETVTRNMDREFGRRHANERIVDNRRVMLGYKSTLAERRDGEVNRVSRRIADKFGTQKMTYVYRSGRSELLMDVRRIQVIQEAINLASDSNKTHKNQKSLGFILPPATSSSDKQSENYQLVNQVMKYFSSEKMVLLIHAIQSMAKGTAAVASVYLPVGNSNAKMFSNEFVPLDNGYKPVSSGNLTTECSAIAASSLWTVFLSEVYSYENKAGEIDINDIKSVVTDSSDGNKCDGKAKYLIQGPNDDLSFKRPMYPKMNNDDGLFSMTIGGCIAALAMSVSTK